MANRRNGDRNIAKQNLLAANNQAMPKNSSNLSSYYDIGIVTQNGGEKIDNYHSSSAHNLEHAPRVASQLSTQIPGK